MSSQGHWQPEKRQWCQTSQAGAIERSAVAAAGFRSSPGVCWTDWLTDWLSFDWCTCTNIWLTLTCSSVSLIVSAPVFRPSSDHHWLHQEISSQTTIAVCQYLCWVLHDLPEDTTGGGHWHRRASSSSCGDGGLVLGHRSTGRCARWGSNVPHAYTWLHVCFLPIHCLNSPFSLRFFVHINCLRFLFRTANSGIQVTHYPMYPFSFFFGYVS